LQRLRRDNDVENKDFYPCPKGHPSTEADFCSECGAKIQGVPTASAAKAIPAVASDPVSGEVQPQPSGEKCPDCAAPRTGDASNFCEICGYNFTTRTHGEIPITTPPPPAVVATLSSQIPANQAPAAPEQEISGWSLSVEIDSSLRKPESPEPPANFAPFTIVLDKAVSLIGRRSDARAIFPEIALDFDDAVSHRHALLERGPDCTLKIRDIGAANGTWLNGKEVQPMSDQPLRDGDQITLGHWTRITVKANH
jgi:hypothetical protein